MMLENLTAQERQYLNFFLDSIREERDTYKGKMDWYADALQEEAAKHTQTKENLKKARELNERHRELNGELQEQLKLRTNS